MLPDCPCWVAGGLLAPASTPDHLPARPDVMADLCNCSDDDAIHEKIEELTGYLVRGSASASLGTAVLWWHMPACLLPALSSTHMPACCDDIGF
jgi:hypothetical protein